MAIEKKSFSATVLSSSRVLDLTDEKGYFCARILGDLGADVIKIERPGGDESRKIGPFYKNEPHPEKSLNWFAYNLNKRGITLDIETRDGKQIFQRLVKKADFLVESYQAGYLDSLGLGYKELSVINPHLVMTSITPFGQTGPYRDYKASDLVGMAMGGLMYMTGTPDRPPVRISFPQAYLQASAHAAAASMIAYYYRETTRCGQHVDVSMQQCVAWGLANAIPLWELNKIILKRVGSYLSGRWTGTKQRLVWKCKDGFVIFIVMGGAFGNKTNRAIVKWMDDERLASEYLHTMDWDVFDMAEQTQELQDKVEESIAQLFLRHTKTELSEESYKRGIMLATVSSSRDIVQNIQLKARDFWVNVEHPELKTGIMYPGCFIKASETPCQIKQRAPLIGEHNLEIYEGELGLSRSEISSLEQAGII